MAGAVLLRSRVQETLAGTVPLRWFKCPNFVACPANTRWRIMAAMALLSVRMLETLATTALLFAAVSEALAGAVCFTAFDMLDV